MKQQLMLSFLFTFFQSLTFGQLALHQKIDSLVQAKMKDNKIVGLSIGIVKDGNTFYTKGYGFTSVDSLFKVSDQTVFYTASITKVFTATALMQFVERGELKLSDKLTDHLPDFKMKDKRYQQITIEQLLTHSSGLPWEHKYKNSTNDSFALEQFVKDLRKEKLKFTPGQKCDGTTYSNVAYSILGLIIQRKSGMPYEEYIQKNILEPIQMTNSYLDFTQIKQELKAEPIILSGTSKEIQRFNLYGEVKDINPMIKYPTNALIKKESYGRTREHAPNTGLLSSATDLCSWMNELLSIYTDTSAQIESVVSNSTLHDMWALKHSIPNFKTSMGLCWWRYTDTEFGDYVFHVGREPGFSSVLLIFPEKKTGITILCNGMYADQFVWNELPMLLMGLINEEENKR